MTLKHQFTFWGWKQVMKRLNYWIFGEKSGARTKYNRDVCQLTLVQSYK